MEDLISSLHVAGRKVNLFALVSASAKASAGATRAVARPDRNKT
jgi:hypothetical protein